MRRIFFVLCLFIIAVNIMGFSNAYNKIDTFQLLGADTAGDEASVNRAILEKIPGKLPEDSMRWLKFIRKNRYYWDNISPQDIGIIIQTFSVLGERSGIRKIKLQQGLLVSKKVFLQDKGKNIQPIMQLSELFGSYTPELMNGVVPVYGDSISESKANEIIKTLATHMLSSESVASKSEALQNILPSLKNTVNTENLHSWLKLIDIYGDRMPELVRYLNNLDMMMTGATFERFCFDSELLGKGNLDYLKANIMINTELINAEKCFEFKYQNNRTDIEIRKAPYIITPEKFFSANPFLYGIKLDIPAEFKKDYLVWYYNGQCQGAAVIDGAFMNIDILLGKAETADIQFYVIDKKKFPSVAGLLKRNINKRTFAKTVSFLRIPRITRNINGRDMQVLNALRYARQDENQVLGAPVLKKEVNINDFKPEAVLEKLSAYYGIEADAKKLMEEDSARLSAVYRVLCTFIDDELRNNPENKRYSELVSGFKKIIINNSNEIEKLNSDRENLQQFTGRLIAYLVKNYAYSADDAVKTYLSDAISAISKAAYSADVSYGFYSSDATVVASLINSLVTPGIPEDLFYEPEEFVLCDIEFQNVIANGDGSYRLECKWSLDGGPVNKSRWDKVFPGTVILRPFSSNSFNSSVVPGMMEHGSIFVGPDETGRPVCVTSPGGINYLDDVMAGKAPWQIKFYNIGKDRALMKKACEEAVYLMSKNPGFDVQDIVFLESPDNRVQEEKDASKYYFKKLYCFKLIAEAYKAAGCDADKLNEYRANVKDLYQYAISKDKKSNFIPEITVPESYPGGSKAAAEIASKAISRKDFPGAINAIQIGKWLNRLNYNEKQLLYKLPFYTGEEIAGSGIAEEVKVINSEDEK